jgi:hypothetical protein
MTVTNISWLTSFKETIAGYDDNHTETTNTPFAEMQGGMYSYHWALKV